MTNYYFFEMNVPGINKPILKVYGYLRKNNTINARREVYDGQVVHNLPFIYDEVPSVLQKLGNEIILLDNASEHAEAAIEAIEHINQAEDSRVSKITVVDFPTDSPLCIDVNPNGMISSPNGEIEVNQDSKYTLPSGLLPKDVEVKEIELVFKLPTMVYTFKCNLGRPFDAEAIVSLNHHLEVLFKEIFSDTKNLKRTQEMKLRSPVMIGGGFKPISFKAEKVAD